MDMIAEVKAVDQGSLDQKGRWLVYPMANYVDSRLRARLTNLSYPRELPSLRSSVVTVLVPDLLFPCVVVVPLSRALTDIKDGIIAWVN